MVLNGALGVYQAWSWVLAVLRKADSILGKLGAFESESEPVVETHPDLSGGQPGHGCVSILTKTPKESQRRVHFVGEKTKAYRLKYCALYHMATKWQSQDSNASWLYLNMPAISRWTILLVPVSWAAMTKHHGLSKVQSRNLLLTVLKAGKSTIRMLRLFGS